MCECVQVGGIDRGYHRARIEATLNGSSNQSQLLLNDILMVTLVSRQWSPYHFISQTHIFRNLPFTVVQQHFEVLI